MEADNISERSERERQAHNEGLQRTGYYSFFKHTRYHYIHRQQRLQKEFFQCANGKQVLELGTNSWSGLLERNEIKPKGWRVGCACWGVLPQVDRKASKGQAEAKKIVIRNKHL